MVTQLCFSLKSTFMVRAFAFNFTAKYLQEPEVYPFFHPNRNNVFQENSTFYVLLKKLISQCQVF